MVALVGSMPPPPDYKHLVTGNDSEFTSSLGAWTNTGGTMTRDTSYRWGSLAGSLKLVTTAAGHRVDLPITGTFKTGAEYVAFVAVSLEEGSAASASLRTQFGLIGTDARDVAEGGFTPTSRFYAWAGGSTKWAVLGLRWRPTASRTGVTIRVERQNADGSNTQTWHVGWVKVFRLPIVGGPAMVTDPEFPSSSKVFIAPATLSGYSGIGMHRLPNWELNGSGFITMDHASGRSGIQLGETDAYTFSEHTAADLADSGFNIEVGTDYVGIYIAEKDSGTVQLYSDVSGGYMNQLRHRGSGKGWSASDDGVVNARIDAFFQWEFRVAGTLTATTNVGPYFRVPVKCRIDEVQCHVGTAPTGQSILVDVNDDGTTVFTTQGNRPTIAAGTNDDTSGAADGGTAIAKDSVITVDVDQIGSGTAGADLTVHVRGRYIW